MRPGTKVDVRQKPTPRARAPVQQVNDHGDEVPVIDLPRGTESPGRQSEAIDRIVSRLEALLSPTSTAESDSDSEDEPLLSTKPNSHVSGAERRCGIDKRCVVLRFQDEKCVTCSDARQQVVVDDIGCVH